MSEFEKINLDTIISDWERNLLFSKSLSTQTTKSYLHDLSLFIKFLQEYKGRNILIDDIIGISISDWRAWILLRKNNNNKTRSIARGLSALKSLISFLVEKKVIENHAILSVKPPKIEKTLPRPLSIAQVNEILHSFLELKKTDWLVMRDKALVVLIYSVGLRISEALSLNINDIKNSDGFLNIKGKGNKYRSVPLLQEVKSIIDSYTSMLPFQFDNSSPLFFNRFGERISASAIQKIIKASRRLLHLSETVTPHALRHTCASHIMEKSGDIRGIQELLGHSSLSSTQIYTDISKKHMTDVYDKFHPMSSKKK